MSTQSSNRPAKGERRVTDFGSTWVVTAVRSSQRRGVEVHVTPAFAYDTGSRRSLSAYPLETWLAFPKIEEAS